MLALPMSPDVENLIPSFVTDIKTASPMVDRSLHQHFKCLRAAHRGDHEANSYVLSVNGQLNFIRDKSHFTMR